jgi:hypothetical protein
MPTPIFRQEALERLSSPERLDELMHVTSPRSWIALAALGGLIVAALIWSIFTTLSTTVSGSGVVESGSRTAQGLGAIVYVTPADSFTIRPGEDVTLPQADSQGGQPSSLHGTVASIDQIPASQSDMLRTLGNVELVQLFRAAGQVIPVHVRVTVQRQAGSSSVKSRQRIPLVRATITTSRKRIISMIIP